MLRHCMFLACFLLACHVASATCLGQSNPKVVESLLQTYRKVATEKWEADIRKLESLDRATQPTKNGILFIGSSSIRRWDTIARDMAPYKPIRRGYGGAKHSDLAIFAERLIKPHQYRAMVMFVANDISGSADDIPAETTEQLVRYVVGVSHSHSPGTPVILVEVTPTEKRFGLWSRIRETNRRLREIALTTSDCYFLSTAEHYLTAEDQPRAELFVDDKLHLNDSGYRLWGSLIRRRLDEVFRGHVLHEQ